MLQGIKTRWDRMDSSVEQLLENQQRLIDVAKGSATVAQGSKQLVEMSQRAAQQGASPREVEYANQLALLSQRIAKNAAALVSSPESDPELAALLARDAGAFREAQSGLARGPSEPTPRGTAPRPEETRVVAIELSRRAAAFDAGLAAVLQHTSRLVAAKQAVRAITNEAEGLLAETTQLTDVYKSGGKSRVPMWFAIAFSLLAL